MIDGIIRAFRGDAILLDFFSRLTVYPLVATLGFGDCNRPLIMRI